MIKEKKKLTKEEIQKLQDLKDNYDMLINELGLVEAQMLNLEKNKKEIQSKFIEYQEKEQKLALELEKKYGAGRLSIETGEITPI
jgi:hypothetical protein|tara:strand:+ start:37 stop:291 length:255 start_codon:yes stop_codon:yes gene_type:complete